MDISLTHGSYKSIKPFQWPEIPEFAVLTGKNGSGKTQLLELLAHHLASSPEELQNIRKKPAKNPFDGTVLEVAGFNGTYKDAVYLRSDWSPGNLGRVNAMTAASVATQVHHHITGHQRNPSYEPLVQIIESAVGKPRKEISEDEIGEYLPLDYYDYYNRIQLQEGIAESCMAYYLRRLELRDEGKSLDEILTELGDPPWESLNSILAEANFPYYMTEPRSLRSEYQAKLCSRTDSNLHIDISDLSSGEKMLIGLAFWMYNSDKEMRLPKLLLMDEPDAHLHPSEIRRFIEVLEKTLVEKHSVRVIMTTHSPTTVSFAPEYSLYQISRTGDPISKLQSKEAGIELLTDGLVLVNQNNKFILVEDQDDADFYSRIFAILKNRGAVDPDVGLVFIPSSNKGGQMSGGKTVVEAWVNKFVENGVALKGLIDKDMDNVSTENILALHRYSLENYLLDPILVCGSMFDFDVDFEIPGIPITHKNRHGLTHLEVQELQLVADHICGQVQPVLTGLSADDTKTEDVEFIGGLTLKYPRWLLNHRGHDLMAKFHFKYNNAVTMTSLIKSLVTHEMIPADLRDIFVQLQS